MVCDKTINFKWLNLYSGNSQKFQLSQVVDSMSCANIPKKKRFYAYSMENGKKKEIPVECLASSIHSMLQMELIYEWKVEKKSNLQMDQNQMMILIDVFLRS